MLESLKLLVRTEVGVAVVESDDKSDCDKRLIFIQMVEEGTAIGVVLGQRPPHLM